MYHCNSFSLFMLPNCMKLHRSLQSPTAGNDDVYDIPDNLTVTVNDAVYELPQNTLITK